MALERSWERIDPVLFTADGGANGLITIADTSCFKVKQKVILLSSTQTSGIQAEVKKVISPTTLLVGPRNNQKGGNRSLLTRLDVSAFLVTDSATIHAEEQPKAVPTPNDIVKAVYEQEPTLALRNLLVDKLGRPISDDNKLPVTGEFTATLASSPKEQLNAFLEKLDTFDKVEQETIDGTIFYNIYSAGIRVLHLKQTTVAGGFCLEVEFPKILKEDGCFLLQENGDALLKENFNGG